MKAFIFTHCDEWKSSHSMSVAYVDKVFINTLNGRIDLAYYVADENKNGNIEIDDAHKVSKIIIEGNPVDANDYITYGYIKSVEIEGLK